MKKLVVMLLTVMILACSAAVCAADNVVSLSSTTADCELKSLGYIYSRDFLTNDEMYSIQVKAINNTSSRIRCNVFAAVYGADGKLKVASVQEQTIFHDSSNNLVFNIPSNYSDGGKGQTVKVFMWEVGTIKPLTDVLDITAETSN